MKITFITGNQGKADFLARHIDYPIAHQKIDLDEIQSLDLREVAEHKARQAYKAIGSPVLVEDVSLVFEALGELPGPFIKWFEIVLKAEGICRLLDGKSRKAVASVCFVYFDGKKPVFFVGKMNGTIAEKAAGQNGFGFDPIFIKEGHNRTLAQMSVEEIDKHSLRSTTLYPEIRNFLAGIDKV